MFIDDIRNPEDRGFPANMPVFRTSFCAIWHLVNVGCPKFISFDHDLGGDDTSIEVVNFMIEKDIDCEGDFIPKDFKYNVHSDNPVGADNIIGKLGGYLDFRKRQNP